jgi:hypothetical protein
MRIGILAVVLVTCLTSVSFAHPASGIVVDANGQVFFLDTGEPHVFSGFIWKIDQLGQVSAIHDSGGHFLALDAEDRFGSADLMGWFRNRRTQWLLRTPVAGSRSALIQADGSPIVMGRDGALYYASAKQLERAGGEQIARLAPDGSLRTPTPRLPAVAETLGGIRGLAVGPDGSLYISYESAVQRVTAAGNTTTLAENMTLTDCDADVPEYGRLPYLRGVAVGSDGVVYAAATGCRAVLKITGDRVETILKAERPWSPTGVAVFGEHLYVLEYTNHQRRSNEWQPRVRRIGRDGRVTTLVTISAADRARAGGAARWP